MSLATLCYLAYHDVTNSHIIFLRHKMYKQTNQERYQQARQNQVEQRRIQIINMAKDLFLEYGLENVTMQAIADKAQISKMTLYRYFPDRDPIAFEVAVQMLQWILATARPSDDELSAMALINQFCLNMIDSFDELSPAYRYIGMFDHLYAKAYPTDELRDWYKDQIFSMYSDFNEQVTDEHQRAIAITMINTIMSFLEKMAARGELMAQEQEVALSIQITTFRQFVVTYFDTLNVDK